MVKGSAMLSVLYVSRSLLEPDSQSETLDDIQMVSIARNSALDITGLLITTAHYFAQLLEGPDDGVNIVMASITTDLRHHDIHVLRWEQRNERQCPHWRMARFDSENFGQAAIAPILANAHANTGRTSLANLEGLIDRIVLQM